jgi:hypothetical protein
MKDKLLKIQKTCKANKICIFMYTVAALAAFVISIKETQNHTPLIFGFLVASQLCVTVVNQSRISELLKEIIEADDKSKGQRTGI